MTKLLFSLFTFCISMSLSGQEPTTGQTQKFKIASNVEISMVWIPAGNFQMGNTSGVEDKWSESERAHTVTLTSGYWMAQFETTQEVWGKIMDNNPSSSQGKTLPVTDVSWHDVMTFIQKLQQFDPRFDLPSEAHWEHAAKAGTDAAYALPRDEMTWHKENSGNQAHPVGKKAPNPWQLYDIHGNVGEWVKDWKADFNTTAQTDPTGPASGERKLIKGGQFTGRLRHTQSFDRQSGPPDSKYFFTGFRIIRRP